jgi:hypothetical protein
MGLTTLQLFLVPSRALAVMCLVTRQVPAGPCSLGRRARFLMPRMHIHRPLNAGGGGGGERECGMTEITREEEALPSSSRCFRDQVGVFWISACGCICMYLPREACESVLGHLLGDLPSADASQSPHLTVGHLVLFREGLAASIGGEIADGRRCSRSRQDEGGVGRIRRSTRERAR